MATVTSLLSESDASDPPLRIDEIGVMAPWREQVWKLRERLRSRGLGKVDVGTVEVRIHLIESAVKDFS